VTRRMAFGLMLGVLLPGLAAGQTAEQQISWCKNPSAPRPDLIIDGCTAVIQSEPQAWAYTARGNAYFHTAQLDRAIADFNQAIRLDPKSGEAYYGRGTAYAYKFDHDRAIADYDEALRLDPKLVGAYKERGTEYEIAKDHARAIIDYSDAIGLDPTDASLRQQRGDAYFNANDYERAIADYDAALRLGPTSWMLHGRRGDAYMAKKDYARAVADYADMIRLDDRPSYFEYEKRGDAYMAGGDFDQAIADYQRAALPDPGNPRGAHSRGLEKLGRAYLAKRDYARAGTNFTEAIRLESADKTLAPALANETSHRVLANLHIDRGVAELYGSDCRAAAGDFERAGELTARQDADAALWSEIASRRCHLTSRFAAVTRQIGASSRLGPLIRLYLGQSSVAGVMAAAETADDGERPQAICDASFFSAEWSLQQGAKKEAARLFQLAASNCRQGRVELAAAIAELGSLGENRRPNGR